jgi:hypothetical protein
MSSIVPGSWWAPEARPASRLGLEIRPAPNRLHSVLQFDRIDAFGGSHRRPRRISRFSSPILPRLRRSDRALSIAVVRCRCQTLISTGIAYNFKNGCEYLDVQTRRLVDVEVVNVTVAAHVHVG